MSIVTPRAAATLLACLLAAPTLAAQDRPRARALGVAPGILPTGPPSFAETRSAPA